jgi:NAD(P)H-dependent FMN reductase
MKLLVFAGSLRADSYNKKFAREAARLINNIGANSEFIDLKEYPMPPYDGDIELSSGIPETTIKLCEKIITANALVISTPEYNGGIPGILKNVIDWISRKAPMPLKDKHLLLLSASPGALGGIRSLWHSRQPFEALGVHVFPDMMGLPNAHNAFDAQGHLHDEKTLLLLQDKITKFIKHLKEFQDS